MLFLGFVLPLVFLCYRMTSRRTGGTGDNPGISDWILAVIAFVTCLYPVLPLPLGDLGAATIHDGPSWGS